MGKKQAKNGLSAARIEEEAITADGCEIITRFQVEDLLICSTRYRTFSGASLVSSGVAVTPQHPRGPWKVRPER